MKSEYQAKISSVFNELKDFQLKTVDFAYNRLLANNRYLVADEVGLGKTKIAKGIIAKALQEHGKKGKNKPYRVFYICSNQALANQNLKDLNLLNDSQFIDTELNRLIYLAKMQPSTGSFSLSSLTPSTSFKITSGTGLQDERMLIFTVLASVENIEEELDLRGLKWLLLGTVENWSQWQERINWYFDENKNKIVEDIPDLFLNTLKDSPIPEQLYDCKEDVMAWQMEANNMFELVFSYCELLANKRSLDVIKREFPNRNRLINFLRKTLIEVSLDKLDADLFILDEFQRFKELVGVGANKDSEAATLAKKIFSLKGSKCLMLSATPFRLYTTQFEDIDNEDHYQELTELLNFLNGGYPLNGFESLRNKFFKALHNGIISDSTIKTKKLLEEHYRSVLCRTEKMIVSDDKNSIVDSKDKETLKTKRNDLENFIHTDQLFQQIKHIYKQSLNYSIDYNKSVPFPMSFMEGYKSKQKFTDLLNEKPIEISSLIKKNKKVWLNLDKIQTYKLSEFPNAKFRQLVKETVDHGELWKLLWLPPSLPYYKGMGVYTNKETLSKTLIFSKWVMVPKMIAGLISYEVERRTIANKTVFPESTPRYTPKKRASGKFDRRKPLPILRLQTKNSKPNSLRSFTLLYPSKTLASISVLHPQGEDNYKTVREKNINLMKNHLQSLKSYENGENIDRSWYWAAPLLLDKINYPEIYDSWINSLKQHPLTQKSNNESSENKAAAAHISALAKMYHIQPELSGLGKMPDDLAKILFDCSYGSPANCLLRAYDQCFSWENNALSILNQILVLSYDFLLFFDKPEAITAIQINEALKDARLKENKDKTDIQWNLVLRYCIDGNLQAVIDEYIHMLYSKNPSIDELTSAIAKGLNIRTSSITIEGLRGNSTLDNKNLRCHYAVNYGNQNLETEKGISRAGDIINNFNSPFRPFVLASTSLGQEGLDFHYYCRKIMHWNLPRNPVEFEQREGRINRFKGLVIRQNVASKYKDQLHSYKNSWKNLFEIAEQEECKNLEKPEIVPYWHTGALDKLKIERIIPLLPFSKDISIYQELTSVLAIYRLTFGQPRQEELVKAIKENFYDESNLKELYDKLLLQLCPYYFEGTKS